MGGAPHCTGCLTGPVCWCGTWTQSPILHHVLPSSVLHLHLSRGPLLLQKPVVLETTCAPNGPLQVDVTHQQQVGSAASFLTGRTPSSQHHTAVPDMELIAFKRDLPSGFSS
ncbi:hypothetical protein Hamer_G027564 [Homarus americanus]|uniref:Uncharacterized protein n=1 Tax=Homarus americanus TaxID=6706 RepID=A0A8J5K499_HOMAM|nr:hypothetical protein Hamer_G027564 [Homarus americanus]